ncbi:hypothetical protein DPM19_01420 [Actinomadura craniellae]|uniref:Uncharacterized protein n=1 Tax=Actinomadura craniellae TaxID=2231787 RepID=A0A365HCJ2_9ACTN|nr:hypothetical protein DPM19_01420 [Actinomadura craniellae]
MGLAIDAFVKGGSPRWAYLAGFLAGGAVLSGCGGWLLATVRVGVGLALSATDGAGDADRYLDEAESFGRFGAGVFAVQSTVQLPVESAEDLPNLRKLLRSGMRTLSQVEPQAASVGLLFQGRQHVGFHVGRWLNVAGRGVDLYTDIRDGGGASHLRAVRLGPSPHGRPRDLDLALYRREEDGDLTGPETMSVEVFGTELDSPAEGPVCLAVNLNAPVDDASFIGPVLASARTENATAVVVAALPGRSGAPTRALGPSTKEYESTVAAIIAVARKLPAAPGLLYLKGPAVISVALGRYLHDTGWLPMRYTPGTPGTYTRYTTEP